MGRASGEGRGSASFHGRTALFPVLRFEGLRADDGFQRGLCNAVFDRRPKVFAEICAGRKRASSGRRVGGRCPARENTGKDPAAAYACNARKTGPAVTHPTAFPPVARRIQSAGARYCLVESGTCLL